MEIEDQAAFVEALQASMPQEIKDLFFPKPPEGYSLESYRMIFIDELPDVSVNIQVMTKEEVKEIYGVDLNTTISD